jgi:hypothetical protein
VNPAYEIVGYTGSLLVVISLTRSSALWFRLISLAGSTTFLTYGLLISAPPVVATNAVIMGINVWFLYKVFTDEEYFSLLEVDPRSRYLAQFLEFHAADIDRYFPGYDYEPMFGDVPVFVLRDMVPAALFIGRPVDEPHVLQIQVDYAVPRFRDMRMGHYLYDHSSSFFLGQGFTTLRARGRVDDHRGYLKRVGFVPDTTRDCYELALVQ